MSIYIYRRLAAGLLTGLCLTSLSFQAKANGLIGSSVTGTLEFGGYALNYFDPTNDYVPAGYENTAGPTVTVASPAVEFGFQDSGNTDFTNFSATQFTVEDVLAPGAGGTDNAFTMTFTDTAFTGLGFAKATDSFPNGGLTYSLVGDVVTVSWPGGTIHANDDYTSTFTMAVAPEPSTWAAVAVGVGVLGLAARRKGRALA